MANFRGRGRGGRSPNGWVCWNNVHLERPQWIHQVLDFDVQKNDELKWVTSKIGTVLYLQTEK